MAELLQPLFPLDTSTLDQKCANVGEGFSFKEIFKINIFERKFQGSELSGFFSVFPGFPSFP